ncbi:MAG: hypothetical protein ACR2GL_03850 [Thermoleophilaceae bacterium]
MDVPMFVWMFFVLKLPVLAAMLLIWYAVKAPEPEPVVDDEDGGSRRPAGPGSRPPSPRPPRRGPHATPPSPPPERVRITRGRRLRRPAGR